MPLPPRQVACPPLRKITARPHGFAAQKIITLNQRKITRYDCPTIACRRNRTFYACCKLLCSHFCGASGNRTRYITDAMGVCELPCRLGNGVPTPLWKPAISVTDTAGKGMYAKIMNKSVFVYILQHLRRHCDKHESGDFEGDEQAERTAVVLAHDDECAHRYHGHEHSSCDCLDCFHNFVRFGFGCSCGRG